MRPILVISLTALLWLVRAQAQDAITIYRCVDDKGAVSLQDDPCPSGHRQDRRDMTRPVDAPTPVAPKPAAPVPVEAEPAAPAPPPAPVQIERPAPPPMYLCTSYDGIVRESEVYDPNPRCEPIVLYNPHAGELPPEWQKACRWVEDSCVRLSDAEACVRFKKKQREARSAALHAFSDTAAYRKSELRRLTGIVEDSCR